jgi:WhiB family redox-sensing transcriptional regulator
MSVAILGRTAPARTDEDWMADAACRDADPELFFHPEGERGPARRARADAAKTVCAGCAVTGACRTYAAGAGETWGVWGGQSEDDRDLAKQAARDAGNAESIEDMIRLLSGRGVSELQISKLCMVTRATVRGILAEALQQVAS